MICQHCGAGIPDDSKFCTYCGAPLVPQAAAPLSGSPVFPVPYRYTLSLNKLLGDTIELYKQNFGTMCLVGLIIVIFSGVALPFTYAAGFLQEKSLAEGNRILFAAALAGNICFSILGTILQWYIMFGGIRQCLYFARGGTDLQARLMFPPFMLFLKFIGLTLVLGSIYLGILLLCWLLPGIMFLGAYLSGAFADNVFATNIMISLFVVCTIVGLCVMLWMTMRLFLATIFLADRNAGISSAIQDAWRVSAGNFWMLLLAVIVLAIGTMAGYFLCCVGIILTIALPYLGQVLIYLQLTGQPNCLEYPPQFTSFPNALPEIEP